MRAALLAGALAAGAATVARAQPSECNPSCGAHGTCEFPITFPYCKCDDGFGPGAPWTGISYQSCCAVGYCGDHGTCVGPDNPNKDGHCQCRDGYTMDGDGACTVPPAPTDPCADADCGHGSCTTNALGTTCTCKPGYSPEGSPGSAGPARCSVDACAGTPCNAHGTCLRTPDKPHYACECTDDWTGARCQTAPAIHDPCKKVNCGRHGTCSDGDCQCDAGYTGKHCDVAIDHCKGVSCSGHGKCDPETGSCECTCTSKAECWTGKDCSAQTCGKDCGDHGTCKDHECSCNDGYTGASCEIAPGAQR